MIDRNKVFREYRAFNTLPNNTNNKWHFIKLDEEIALCGVTGKHKYRIDEVYINILELCATCYELMYQDCQPTNQTSKVE